MTAICGDTILIRVPDIVMKRLAPINMLAVVTDAIDGLIQYNEF